MKIYIVKYALAKGIEEFEAVRVELENGCKTTNRIVYAERPGCYFWLHEYEFAYTLDDARAKAYAMRDKKIASLKKQISKLEKMEF